MTPSLVKVSQGDQVTLKITADMDAMLHIHGYELAAMIAPGQTAELSFTANATGKFDIYLHESGQDAIALGSLEVYPR